MKRKHEIKAVMVEGKLKGWVGVLHPVEKSKKKK